MHRILPRSAGQPEPAPARGGAEVERAGQLRARRNRNGNLHRSRDARNIASCACNISRPWSRSRVKPASSKIRTGHQVDDIHIELPSINPLAASFKRPEPRKVSASRTIMNLSTPTISPAAGVRSAALRSIDIKFIMRNTKPLVAPYAACAKTISARPHCQARRICNATSSPVRVMVSFVS